MVVIITNTQYFWQHCHVMPYLYSYMYMLYSNLDQLYLNVDVSNKVVP